MILVYVVCGDREEGLAISRGALELRLAASVNMFPIQSVYWWKGALVEGEEYVLLFKTVDEHFTALSEYVRGVHSYETPAIMRLPVSGVDSRYLEWLVVETSLS